MEITTEKSDVDLMESKYFHNPNAENSHLDWTNSPGYNTWKKKKGPEELAKYSSASFDSKKVTKLPNVIFDEGEDVLDFPQGIKRQLSNKSTKEIKKALKDIKHFARVSFIFTTIYFSS